MMDKANIQAQETQCVEGFRLMLQGMYMVFGTMAESIGTMTEGAGCTDADPAGVPKASEKRNTKVASKKQDTPAAPAATTEVPGGMPVSRSDVERVMAAKIKELSAKGEGPGAVGQLFPMFHEATCISDLTDEDYPVFLAELAKL